MIINTIDIINSRREYRSQPFNRSDLTNKPDHLFKIWLHYAYLAKVPDPTATCLATVDKCGQPYQRLVLLKELTEQSMIFYTNLNSRKSIHLENNPKVSLCFPWNAINRQVIVTGHTSKLSTKEVLKYFFTRPRNNQIGTWISQQSNVISSKKILENKFLTFQSKYLCKKIPFPEFWGGYKVHIKSIEFWQGREHRLHDRFIYKRSNNNQWIVNRLSP